MTMKIFILVLIAILKCSMCFSENINKSQRIIKEKDILYVVENEEKFTVDKTVVTIKPVRKNYSIPDDATILKSNSLGYIDIRVPDNVDIEKYIEKLKNSNAYETVEYNTIGKYYYSPDDAYSSYQWHLSAINLFNAWNITTGNPNIKIAIIDSGIDTNHIDLGYGYDGYTNIDFSNGWNYENNSSNVITTNDHGTIVAGIAGAKTNNSIGIAGIAGGNNSSGTTIIPYCIGTTNPQSSYIDDAIIDAVDKGVKVINLSLGIPTNTAINAAIEYAYNHNVSIVCASGNSYSSTINYPASHQKTIAVGSINSALQRSDFSNYGYGLSVMAPGNNIYSTQLSNSFGYSSGTSFAAPQVTGCIALMLSLNAYLSPTEIRSILESTANKLSGYSYNTNGWNQEVGYGLLNVHEALLKVLNMSISGASDLFGTNTYSVSNLPSDYSVSWSFVANGITPAEFSFQPNTPQIGKCTTTYTNRAQNFSGTLYAAIYKGTTLVTTLSRVLSHVFYPAYIGTYSQVDNFNVNHFWDIPTTEFYDEDNIFCNIKSTITLNSPLFACYNTTYSGVNLTSWNNQGNGTITLMFRYSATDQQHLTVTGRDYHTDQLIYQFYLTALPVSGSIILEHLNVSMNGETLNIELDNLDDNDRSLQEISDGIADNNENLLLTITHSITGRNMYRGYIRGVKTEVSTSTWPKGVYIVRAEIGENSVVRKISIR